MTEKDLFNEALKAVTDILCLSQFKKSGFHPIGKPMGFRHEFITHK